MLTLRGHFFVAATDVIFHAPYYARPSYGRMLVGARQRVALRANPSRFAKPWGTPQLVLFDTRIDFFATACQPHSQSKESHYFFHLVSVKNYPGSVPLLDTANPCHSCVR